jgi:hypothetical protein
MVGGLGLGTNVANLDEGARYEAADGGVKIPPPPLMDGGTSTTAPAQLTQ